MSISVCTVFLYLICFFFVFFFKQKTAYEMRISDWCSDVCSSDLQFQVSAATTENFREKCLQTAVDLIKGILETITGFLVDLADDVFQGLQRFQDRKSVV